MSLTVVDLVDSIAGDLASIAVELAGASYTDWRYVAPDALTVERAPWLAVYPAVTNHRLIATPDQYEDEDSIEIEWAVSIADGAEAGQPQLPVQIRPTVIAATAIVDRLRTYADGLPGLTNQIVGTLVSTSRPTALDLVWRQVSILEVSQLGAGGT
jgi:hypothetical protein